MEPNPIRVIALCSQVLGIFFLAKSISIKTPKYVLHELLDFKVNKSRFFRKHISQKLEVVIGFVFLFVGLTLQIFLEADALGRGRLSQPTLVILATVIAMLGIAVLLNRVTRFFSGKIFVEHVRFLVREHGYPLEKDQSLMRELGGILRVDYSENDTLESYAQRVRQKMKLEQPPDESRF
jgi:hypothetical protein